MRSLDGVFPQTSRTTRIGGFEKGRRRLRGVGNHVARLLHGRSKVGEETCEHARRPRERVSDPSSTERKAVTNLSGTAFQQTTNVAPSPHRRDSDQTHQVRGPVIDAATAPPPTTSVPSKIRPTRPHIVVALRRYRGRLAPFVWAPWSEAVITA